MKKRGIIMLGMFLVFLLSFQMTSSQDFQKAINEKNKLFIAEGNRIYAIETNEGKILWEHDDEGQINGMELIDWNSDAEKDLVIASQSQIMPPLKILDGKTGEILKGFYPKEKTYEGSTLQPVENLKVINSEIIFSSGWILYKAGEEIKRLNLFKNRIGKIESGDVQGEIKVISYVENQRREDLSRKITYDVDLEGEIHDVDEITGSIAEETDFNRKKFSTTNNCERRHFKSSSSDRISVAGATLNQKSDFYCLNGFLYYLNGSGYLIKRHLDTESETPLRQIKCSGNQPTSRQVLGENVMCEEMIDLKNGKKVTIKGRNDEFFTYYDGEKELIIENKWPFSYRHGNNRGNVSFEILNENQIHDFSGGWDYDKDGKKEVMLFFGNGETNALVFFEISTGQKELITLILTEQQVKNRNNTLTNNLTGTQKRLDETRKKETGENNERDSLTRRIDEKNDEARREDNETERRKIDREIKKLEDKRDDVEDGIAKLQKDKGKLTSEIEIIRQEIRKLNSGGGQAKIKSFDFCSGKLFINSLESVYVFEHGKEKKEMSFSGNQEIENRYLNPHYVTCLDDGKLGVFTYSGVYVAKEDGTGTKKTDSKEDRSLMGNQKAVRIKSGGKIYVPVIGGNGTRQFIQIYNSKGNLESEKEIENEVFSSYSREGKTFFCLERFEREQKAYLLDEGIKGFSFSRPESLGYENVKCEKLIVDDCDNDGGNELSFWVRTNETGEKSKRICLNENEKSFINVTGWGTVLEGRIAGEYFIKTKKSENPFYEIRERKNVEFPHEVYNGKGEKVLVSLKPVFLESNGFTDYEGNEIKSSDSELIKSTEVNQNEVLVTFGIPGEKIIFVDGAHYERTEADETILKLAAGERDVKAYYYNTEDGNVYLDGEKVKIESSNPISPVSWILPIIFIITATTITLIRRMNK